MDVVCKMLQNRQIHSVSPDGLKNKNKNIGTSHNHHISEDVWGYALLLPTEQLKV